MIIDSHCHAWRYWPYDPPVPDPFTRGSIDQLLFEMDRNQVDKAVIICAGIDHNHDNNAYVAGQIPRFGDRFIQFADVDSFWTPTYHRPGAADRLRSVAANWPIRGFTHYLRGDDDGSWLTSDQGTTFFEAAQDLNLIASIACHPHHHIYLRQIARAFPSLNFLVHHMGLITIQEPSAHDHMEEVLSSAGMPNIYLKFSGFAYATSDKWDFPYRSLHSTIQSLFQHYGPWRMCWGSDYPVVRQFMTYEQSLEVVRSHCTFIPATELNPVLGGALAKLLEL